MRKRITSGFLCKPALVLGLVLFCHHAQAISNISIQIGQVEAPQGQARNVRLDYGLQQSKIALQGQYKLSADQDWAQASLTCGKLLNPVKGAWQCDQGRLSAGQIDLPFSLKFDTQRSKGMRQVNAELGLVAASFSDAAGLHAGEKVTGKISLHARQEKQGWRWQADTGWASGEVFWQPFYFASGGHRLQATGVWSDDSIKVDEARISIDQVGSASLKAELIRKTNSLKSLELATDSLDLAALYPLLLKPLLEKTALNNLEMAGKGVLRLTMREGELKTAQLDLAQADIDDKNGRFGLYKIDANLPWDYDQAKTLKLAYEGGHLLHIPLGRTDIAAGLNRYSLTAPLIQLPILDGALNLKDVSAVWLDKEWHWHLRANIAPISMAELSRALGWPTMQGKVAATIPLVTYSGGLLVTDGDMQFNLFDGVVSVNNLAMQTPLGVAPRLTANLQMRNLDLGTLTRTFSFGAIEGKLDGDVRDLRLVNWKPVHFDAAVYSSPGRHRKKISQRAVENISALGGAGAAAAIQRSVLRFFDEFNYVKLGLSCKLRNDHCEMDGVESTREGYVIVKGSGIPAITVLGYNRNVSWSELLERIKRVTAGNSKPIIE
ncbi:hypothetical protein MTYP_00600 [Methylophilaceae bacterium]|nr:hypothetical protein MTYP_00600 [Methylophilaceae bacterium]